MDNDPKRELLRHMLATLWFRGRIAIADAPEDFAFFRASDDSRSAGEILAHILDLINGSHHLMKGEFVELRSLPAKWKADVARFESAVRKLDAFLAAGEPLAYPVEKFVQGPIGDALTHIGQIVLLRRLAGAPIAEEQYFSAELRPGYLRE